MVFTDGNATGLQIEKAIVINLGPQEGFAELADMIAKDRYRLIGYKVVVFLIGRADFWIEDTTFEKQVVECIRICHEKNADLIIVLAATLPVPGDTRKNIETSNFRTNLLARMSAKSELLDFAKPGKRLIRRPGGAIREFF